MSAHVAITEHLARIGVLRGGEAFLPAAMASFVGGKGDRQVDVAVANQDLELSGFYVVARDDDQALKIAASMPVVGHGVVEVRPLLDLPSQGLPPMTPPPNSPSCQVRDHAASRSQHGP